MALPAAWDEIQALPPRLGARMIRMLAMVVEIGLHQIREPHAKHLGGKRWELRAKAEEDIARGLYVAVAGWRVVVLHVFEKRTEKTPLRGIALARARMQEIER